MAVDLILLVVFVNEAYLRWNNVELTAFLLLIPVTSTDLFLFGFAFYTSFHIFESPEDYIELKFIS